MSTRSQGDAGERLARSYLEQRGFSFVEAQFHARSGEIDLIMRDGAELVFVEVKLRGGDRFGSGLEAIGRTKRARLRRTAAFYLLRHRITAPWRIDVVVVDTSSDPPSFEHLPSAIGED